jgi:Zn-dependent alcohol dehydrogenase
MPTATAAVLSANHAPFVLEEIEVERPQRGEVMVRVVATGLCHTDLSAREGLIPFPLPGVVGHEGAGIGEDVGDGVTDLEVGDHVVMSFAFCSACRTCRTGHPVYCESWADLNLFGGGRADGTPSCTATARRSTATSSVSPRSLRGRSSASTPSTRSSRRPTTRRRDDRQAGAEDARSRR